MPTDPAPRGADAPDFGNENPETFGAPDFTRPLAKDEAWAVWWGRPYMRIVKRPEQFKEFPVKLMWDARAGDGHRVVRVRIVPVPAEATSGAVTPGPFTRAIREQALNLIDECVAVHGEEAAQSRGHERGCWFLRYADALTTLCEDEEDRLAALRTPPAPLPREGAMRTEIESAMRELLDIRMDDLRCPVGITDEAFAGAALGAWKRIRYAMEHLTVALTPAAQPTTKETR